MSRWTKKSTKNSYVSLPLYQDAIIRYYSEKYHRDHIDVLRTIISQYAKADKRFSAEDYLEYVGNRYVDVLRDSGDVKFSVELLEELNRQVEEYLGKDYDPSSLPFLEEIVKPESTSSAKKKGTATAAAKKTRRR